MNFVYISVGAIFGATSRYLLQLGFLTWFPGFPWGTFAANAVGSFLVGLCFPILTNFTAEMRLLLITGYLGALTTLSAYHAEFFDLILQKRYTSAIVHWTGGSIICLILCGLGIWLGQLLSTPTVG